MYSNNIFIPKFKEKYYVGVILPNGKSYITDFKWEDDSADLSFLNQGIIFKTKKEAEEKVKELLVNKKERCDQ